MEIDFSCICTGLTEKAVKNYMYNGIGSIDEMCMMTRCGRRCTNCRPNIDRLFELEHIG